MKEREEKKERKKTPQDFHRLTKSIDIVTIPANAPTTPTTPHLVYSSKYVFVIDGSDNVTPLNEYRTMPVVKATIE